MQPTEDMSEEETYDYDAHASNEEEDNASVTEERDQNQQFREEDENEPILGFESHHKIVQLKGHVDWNVFSRPQKLIAFWKLTGHTIAQIQEKWNHEFDSFISGEAIITCIKSIALSRTWQKGQNGGNNTYLCRMDTQTLVNELYERAHIADAFDTTSLLVFAGELKRKRIQHAIWVLEQMQCFTLAEKFKNKTINNPHRTWINKVYTMLDAKLLYPVMIDGSRFTACTRDHIRSFYIKFETLLRTTPPELIFCADETMLDTTLHHKVVIPSSMQQYFEGSYEGEIPHITAMCCNNIIGDKPPLFILLKERLTVPDELLLLTRTHIQLASTSSGWMDRWSFLYWTVHFISWYCSYIDNLPTSYKGKAGLLILDGHRSRECPLALELFMAFNINVITLPGHSSHVMQLFDIGIGSPMKRRYTELLKTYLKDSRKMIRNSVAATLRNCSVHAIVEAWQQTCTPTTCINTARELGYYPYDPEIVVTSNPHIRELTPRELEMLNNRRATSHLDINNSLLTTVAKITEIAGSIRNDRDGPLCKHINEFHNIDEIFNFIFKGGKDRKVFQLSKPLRFRGYDFSHLDQRW